MLLLLNLTTTSSSKATRLKHMVMHAEEPASTTQGTNDSGLTTLPERRPDPAVLDQRCISTTHRLFAGRLLASILRSWGRLAAAHCWKKLTTHRHSSKKALKVLPSVCNCSFSCSVTVHRLPWSTTNAELRANQACMTCRVPLTSKWCRRCFVG